jgi:hypothetical protein
MRWRYSLRLCPAPSSAPTLNFSSAASGASPEPVVPGNWDLVDTLGVEPPPFLHPSFYVDGHSGSGAGLPPHSGRPSD